MIDTHPEGVYMYVSPISFQARQVVIVNNKAAQIKKTVPVKEKLLEDINFYWKELNNNPIDEFSYKNLKIAEKKLQKNYPKEFMHYMRTNGLL